MKFVLIAGSSGVGKGKILKAITQITGYPFSVSMTSRQPREEEVDGVAYTFLDRHKFLSLVHLEQMLEWSESNGHLYGTPVSELCKAENAPCLLMELDLNGCMEMQKKFPNDTYTIFVKAPSLAEQARRLRGRKDRHITEEEINARLSRSAEETKLGMQICNAVVVNDSFDQAVVEILGLIAKWLNAD